ncbi:MAG: YggS family pyridoxal phosphate-dependent enzyme [Chloroflexi bacterium]|jgi:pyridoxal phosphate enzyme (YggS family)|uniref:Pyridoxal phosphate homeostasis protein n=1 Tax=Candidatus Thermofonsia Clade 3 bacterium TaxID=2364212 RepID=A0A2M8QEV7_9CHLR|nr:YggS family pyridoxal phosphate-dependent enzyme [Candidatus Roseilinea sp. NK_OTU-006]PJF48345.1 MAG: YggS family pyridoxal phosphate-dependent enzyme [Candidatus Thermofonsia Clade 3 bacterium]RMG62274.1 MAG: YggS family pyridoxal phosphate-dependent enzyme [Chloroflexota bacterium]
MADVQRALAQVRERIAEACLRAGRAPDSVTLVAVSKTFPAEAIAEAAAAGQRDFGENRVEEALPKIEEVKARLAAWGLGTDLRWHVVGHLQSRKARDAAGRFHLIHSVDSLKLAGKLNARCAAQGVVQPILLECNVSGEDTKNGFQLHGWERNRALLDAFADQVAQIAGLLNLRVCGLMTMAPIVEQPDEARPVFASLRALRDALSERMSALSLDHLSMGMTDDFEAAIAEGATMVRIGRAIFGARG